MKNILCLSALLIGLFMFSGNKAYAQSATGTAGGYCGCTSCNCLHSYGNCAWCVTDMAYSGADNEMPVQVTILNPKSVRIDYQIPLAETHEENLTIQSNVSLPQSICAMLGVNAVIITPGSYIVDYSQNPNGSIVCNTVIQ